MKLRIFLLPKSEEVSYTVYVESRRERSAMIDITYEMAYGVYVNNEELKSCPRDCSYVKDYILENKPETTLESIDSMSDRDWRDWWHDFLIEDDSVIHEVDRYTSEPRIIGNLIEQREFTIEELQTYATKNKEKIAAMYKELTGNDLQEEPKFIVYEHIF